MKVVRLILLSILIASEAFALSAEKAIDQYVHDAWTTEQGLAHNVVETIHRSAAGYLWVGTQGGLVRYDGARFVTFSRRTHPQLKSHSVRAIYEAPDGTLWIGTGGSGLCRLDQNELTCYGREAGLPSSVVHALAPAAVGLWVGTDRGVSRFDPLTRRADSALLEGAIVRALHSLASGDLYVATLNEGLARLRGGQLERWTTREGLSSNSIFHLLQDDTQRLWIATSAGIDLLVDGHVERHPGKNAPRGPVYALEEDSSGNIWVGTEASGVLRFRDGTFMGSDRSPRLAQQRVLALHADGEGSLWIGTASDGLQRLRDGLFTSWTFRHGLAADRVFAISRDGSGALWMATDGGGLSVLSQGRVETLTSRDGLSSDRVWALARQPDGALLIGTYRGLDILRDGRISPLSLAPFDSGQAILNLYVDRSGRRWIATRDKLLVQEGTTLRLFAEGDDRLQPPVNFVLEASDGSIWFATDDGLTRLHSGALTRYTPRDGLPSDSVFCLHEDSRGNLWVGTRDGGLARLRNGRFETVSTEHGLFDQTIHSILEDTHGQLWMSSSRGIFRVSLDELEQVASGRRARLTSVAYGITDGMATTECSEGAGLRDGSGRLWFPTAKGLVVVDPTEALRPQAPPVVRIEEARADGIPVHDGMELGPEAANIELHFTSPVLSAAHRIHFRYQLEAVDRGWVDAGHRRNIHYASVPPGRHTFRVAARIDDGEWTPVPAQLRFTKRAWFYQTAWFRAVGALSLIGFALLGWVAREKKLKHRQRELARLVEARTQELTEKNRLLEQRTSQLHQALEELRTAQSDVVRAEKAAAVATLVSGIAHELNNPIGFILGNLGPLRRYCEFLIRITADVQAGRVRPEQLDDVLFREDKRLSFVIDDLERLLNSISEGGRRAKLIIGDLQHLTTGPHRSWEKIDLAQRIRQTVALLSARSGANVSIREDLEEVAPVTARAGHLEQLLTNLLDNALRAVSSGGEVSVTLRAEQAGVAFSVADNGPGMTDEVRRRAFEPFFTTRTPGQGSGLGLAIAASIVSAHHGRIDLQSAPGRGTTVSVWLPTDPERVQRPPQSAPGTLA